MNFNKTICIVASKSGSTAEPLVFQEYFYGSMRRVHGERVGEYFTPITDPGSMLEQTARWLPKA